MRKFWYFQDTRQLIRGNIKVHHRKIVLHCSIVEWTPGELEHELLKCCEKMYFPKLTQTKFSPSEATEIFYRQECLTGRLVISFSHPKPNISHLRWPSAIRAQLWSLIVKYYINLASIHGLSNKCIQIYDTLDCQCCFYHPQKLQVILQGIKLICRFFWE